MHPCCFRFMPLALLGAALLCGCQADYEKSNTLKDKIGQSEYQLAPPYEDWVVPTDPRHKAAMDEAHAIQIPQPLPAHADCRTDMTRKSCYEHLCKNYAGEFVYQAVTGVEGIYEMRPPPDYLTGPQREEDRYASEDPFDDPMIPGFFEFEFIYPRKYRFYETWRDSVKNGDIYNLYHPSYKHEAPPGKWLRFSGYYRKTDTMIKEVIDAPTARYGYTWRGVRLPVARRLGVAGGELIVIDRKSQTILGVRRGFVAGPNIKNHPHDGISWMNAARCNASNIYTFTGLVARPIDSIDFALEVKTNRYGDAPGTGIYEQKTQK